MSEQMLTEEQCAEFRRLPGTFNDMVRAIYEAGRASKAAEYADVPPEKWKALYLVACDVRKNVMKWAKVRTANHLANATFDIDNGTYNPKIGGE